MKILVTGANGWLGKSLVNHILKNSLKPYVQNADSLDLVLTHHPSEETGELLQISKPLSAALIPLDITDNESVEKTFKSAKIDYVIHTAGIIHPQKVSDFYKINVGGTENVLTAAKKNGCQKMVILSSNSPFGFNKNPQQLFNESSSYNPYMNYGKSKRQMEERAQELSQDKVMETVLIRAPWFYGPFQPDRQTLFFKMIQDGKFPTVGNGENLRSMAFTDNLSEGLLRALFKKGHYGQAYWIADKRPYSMNEIIETVKSVLKNEFQRPVSDRRIFVPGILSNFAEIADGTLQSCGIYHQKIHVLSEMSRSIACSVEKAQKDLGYVGAVELYEGMKQSIAYCIQKRIL